MKTKIVAFLTIFFSLINAALFFPLTSLAQVVDPNEAIGTLDKPPGAAQLDVKAQAETGSDIGLMLLVSNIIKLMTIVMGLWALINFLMAGYKLITGQGDPGAMGKAQNQITLSVLGLVLIIATYTAVGIIGLLFFGDAGFILNPTVTGPTP